jgi:hypothetical protein
MPLLQCQCLPYLICSMLQAYHSRCMPRRTMLHRHPLSPWILVISHPLHSMLHLRNGPRLPPSLLLERPIHPCLMTVRSIITRQTGANARICQEIQTVNSSGTVHSRRSSILARSWLRVRSVPVLSKGVQKQRAMNTG